MFGKLFTKQKIDVLHLPKKEQKRAEKRYEAYKKWYETHSARHTNKKIIPRYVWTDRKGVNWYVLDDFDANTNERMNAIELQLQAVKYGVSTDYLIDVLSEIAEGLNGYKATMVLKSYNIEKLALLQSKALEAKFRLSEITPDNIILRLATLLYVIDDENPYIIDNELNDRKLEMILEDSESRAFFLKTALETFNILTKLSDTELLAKLAGQG